MSVKSQYQERNKFSFHNFSVGDLSDDYTSFLLVFTSFVSEIFF